MVSIYMIEHNSSALSPISLHSISPKESLKCLVPLGVCFSGSQADTGEQARFCQKQWEIEND